MPRFGIFVQRQMEALAERGDWDVTVINPVGIPPIAFGRYAPLQKACVDGRDGAVTVYRRRFTLIPRFGAKRNPQAIVAAVLPLARQLHADKPFDLVDAQFFYPDGPAAAHIARELGLPLSVKARGADIHHWGALPWAREQIVAVGRQAAGMLAVSQALADDMAALGLPREKITLHYTGLDRERFVPLGREQARMALASEFGFSLRRGQVLLTTVGALIERKGQAIAIEALTRLPNAALALAGTGPDAPQLEALAARLGVAERVHFLGSIGHETLPVLLSASHAMVLPSASEGLANAWVEALACGTPIVIADAGGAREVVKDASAGRIVDRDPAAIAEAVKQIVSDPPAPEKVAANAARFSWNATAAALAEYYARILSAA